jgi:L-threonylcarbamoyladenylate synthase
MDLSAADSASAETVRRAARILRDGGLVAFPTETVYGLGADATNDRAVARIFEAKARPKFNPLIVHVTGREAAAEIAAWPDLAERLAARFWPGPLTLILPRKATCRISWLVSAGGETVALRAPSHPLASALLEATGLPIAAPSANPAGKISPTTAEHVKNGLGDRVDLILDGGACPVGVESTVVDVTSDRPLLLRPGGLARAEIEAVIGAELTSSTARTGDNDRLRSPGQLDSHYAPSRPVRLNAKDVAADEALLAFGPAPLEGAKITANLSRNGDVTEAAANLFAMMHALDQPQVKGIAVMPIPAIGLGEAIRDRLKRASSH